VPIDRYRPSGRDFSEAVPPFEYALGDHLRKIQQKGATSLFGRAFKICNAFAGRTVAFRPTQKDGVFDVYFRHQKIQTIDLNAISR
jgi:2-hydroxychromene-2-carboxylate isomerase